MNKILVIGGNALHMHRWFHYVVTSLDGMKVDMFCKTMYDGNEYEGARCVYQSDSLPFIFKIIQHIPKLRVLIWALGRKKTIERIFDSEQYDAINIHQPSPYDVSIVKAAKSRNIKVIVTPWGSDVLRCSKRLFSKMELIFKNADYVTSNIKSFADKYIEMYHIDPSKMVHAGFGSEVFDIIPEIKGKYSKKEIAGFLGVPVSDYYIACGYTAHRAQNHLIMIDALGVNKSLLPNNTLLLFQFTYGCHNNQEYINEIKEKCDKYGMKYHFLTHYMSNDDMAKYRLLADLFIHIQPTDASNASLSEFLLADCDCINGGWLCYPHLEKYGMPYYICPSLDDLPNVVKDVLQKKAQRISLPIEIKNLIMMGSWKEQKKYWIELFKTL